MSGIRAHFSMRGYPPWGELFLKRPVVVRNGVQSIHSGGEILYSDIFEVQQVLKTLHFCLKNLQ